MDTWTVARNDAETDAFEPVALAFDHPLWIVYPSGTTGKSKPIVHGHGGIVLTLLTLKSLHNDIACSYAPNTGRAFSLVQLYRVGDVERAKGRAGHRHHHLHLRRQPLLPHVGRARKARARLDNAVALCRQTRRDLVWRRCRVFHQLHESRA